MIKQYTVMSAETDQPVRYCQCSESDKDIIVGEGEYIVEGRLEAEQNPEGALANIRMARDVLLLQSDWTQMPDSPLSQEQRQAWADYRQALRDLPQSNLDLDAVKWPQQPEV